MSKFLSILAFVFGVFCSVVLLMMIFAWPFMWIWNYAVVNALTIAKPITYWTAFWLSLFLSLYVRTSLPSSKKG